LTLVKKTINGRGYLYYQDSLPDTGTVTTFVGSKDLTPEEFAVRRDNALPLHVFKLYKKRQETSGPRYHFENQPTIRLEDPDELELSRLTYRQIEGSLTEAELDELQSSLFVKYVHGTTAIEGNTLSESEARSVLLSDLTPKAKSVSETLEVSNYRIEREFIDSYSGDLTEKLVLQIHRLLMSGVRKPNGKSIPVGEYRKTKVILREADYVPPPPELVEDRMSYVLDEHRQGIESRVHPIELAAVFHVRFEEVHPFEDGNGRVGREILNFMLRRNGYPGIVVGLSERSAYLAAIREGDERNFVPIVDFVVDRIDASVAYVLARTGFLKTLGQTPVRGAAKRPDDEEYRRYVKMLESLRDRGQRPSATSPQP
jgi:fido (protein-threonine AMPylation protein)